MQVIRGQEKAWTGGIKRWGAKAPHQEKEVKIMMNICALCQKVYGPEELNGVRRLKVFERYTIDLRLKQFRKAEIGQELEFIEFDSKEGQELLRKMHEAVLIKF